VVLYGCETWSLAFREEHRLSVFQNRVLSDEMMEGWRKLPNKELHDLYSSPSIIRIIKSMRKRWAQMGEKRKACRLLVRKPVGNKPLGRP
jgi:hypothetical protein